MIAREIIPMVVIAAVWRDIRDFFRLCARMICGTRA